MRTSRILSGHTRTHSQINVMIQLRGVQHIQRVASAFRHTLKPKPILYSEHLNDIGGPGRANKKKPASRNMLAYIVLPPVLCYLGVAREHHTHTIGQQEQQQRICYIHSHKIISRFIVMLLCARDAASSACGEVIYTARVNCALPSCACVCVFIWDSSPVCVSAAALNNTKGCEESSCTLYSVSYMRR